MMFLWWALLAVAQTVAVTTPPVYRNLPDGESAALRKALMALLGLSKLPDKETSDALLAKVPPFVTRRVEAVFEDLQQADEFPDGNTVRALLPRLGKANGNEALLFDVSSVGEDEKILRAELHFHLPQAHRHGSRRRAKSVRASVACTHHFCRSAYPLTHIEATRTTAVMDATLPFAQLHAINGTTMAVHMWRKDIKMRGPKDLVRRNPPFLLVFTEADPQLPEPEEAEAVEISERRGKLTAENRILRAKRDTGEYFKYSEPPRVKAKLTRAEEMAEKQKKDPWYGFGDTSDEDEDDEEDDDDDERIVLLDKAVNDQCRLIRRLVSTSSLGLETTILSPSHLDLSQCGGGCEKPGKKSSARARLLWSVGPSMWRGAVCCAPSRLAPLPLMLLDTHGNLVLRLLPDTVASKCQCL